MKSKIWIVCKRNVEYKSYCQKDNTFYILHDSAKRCILTKTNKAETLAERPKFGWASFMLIKVKYLQHFSPSSYYTSMVCGYYRDESNDIHFISRLERVIE